MREGGVRVGAGVVLGGILIFRYFFFIVIVSSYLRRFYLRFLFNFRVLGETLGIRFYKLDGLIILMISIGGCKYV